MTQIHASPATYLWIWVWLAGLMLLSVFLSEAPVLSMTRGVLIGLVLLLSTIKALLVAMYYMHLRFDRPWLLIIVVFPLFLIALAVLVVYSSTFVRL